MINSFLLNFANGYTFENNIILNFLKDNRKQKMLYNKISYEIKQLEENENWINSE